MVARPYNERAEIEKLAQQIEQAKKRALKIMGRSRNPTAYGQITAAYGELVDAMVHMRKAQEA